MSEKKTLGEQCDDLDKSIRELRQAIRQEMLDPITRPIFNYFAFKDTIRRIKLVIPPKHHNNVKIVTRVAKSLPRDLRGAYTHLVQSKVQSGLSIKEAAGYSLIEIMDFKDDTKEIEG